jgi:hypothetical protein
MVQLLGILTTASTKPLLSVLLAFCLRDKITRSIERNRFILPTAFTRYFKKIRYVAMDRVCSVNGEGRSFLVGKDFARVTEGNIKDKLYESCIGHCPLPEIYLIYTAFRKFSLFSSLR